MQAKQDRFSGSQVKTNSTPSIFEFRIKTRCSVSVYLKTEFPEWPEDTWLVLGTRSIARYAVNIYRVHKLLGLNEILQYLWSFSILISILPFELDEFNNSTNIICIFSTRAKIRLVLLVYNLIYNSMDKFLYTKLFHLIFNVQNQAYKYPSRFHDTL